MASRQLGGKGRCVTLKCSVSGICKGPIDTNGWEPATPINFGLSQLDGVRTSVHYFSAWRCDLTQKKCLLSSQVCNQFDDLLLLICYLKVLKVHKSAMISMLMFCWHLRFSIFLLDDHALDCKSLICWCIQIDLKTYPRSIWLPKWSLSWICAQRLIL